MIDDDWWPDLLRHIPEEQPWALNRVTVAELGSYREDPWLTGTRTLYSALVPMGMMERLGDALAGFHYRVETSGPGPAPDAAGTYRPEFWITAIDGDERLKCEPLVLSWESNNQTAMVIEPGFLMTYGLVPRALEDGTISWDDPAEPEFDIAIIDPPSRYADGAHSGARVVISRDHLQDYLTLRGVALVQVYYESRRGRVDDAMDTALGDEVHINPHLKGREFDLQRRREGGYIAQIWGARVVATPGTLPVSIDPLNTQGLIWPGFDGPVTNAVARAYRPWDFVYVRDTVLGAYEGKPGFTVHPETGGVSYGNQWGVGPATRVGRDVIRIELRKLYEGTRRAVQHWHDHAIAPTPELIAPAAREVRNVGVRSGALVYGLARIGLRLRELADLFDLEGLRSDDFVALDGPDIDYRGWWNAPHVEPITRHIAPDIDRDAFLNRCLALDKVLVEALAQRHLRRLVRAIATPPDKIDDFRGLKLLDRVVCLAQVAEESGLRLWESGPEIAARLRAEGTEPPQPLAKLFALSDLRQLAGHRKDDMDERIADALTRFGLAPASAVGGWGLLLDQIYDQLGEQLSAVDEMLRAAILL